MKLYMAAFTLFAALAAVPGQALALTTTWHCVAHPGTNVLNQVGGVGLTKFEAGKAAELLCKIQNPGSTCITDWDLCHIDDVP
jgi:hypothetical protein